MARAALVERLARHLARSPEELLSGTFVAGRDSLLRRVADSGGIEPEDLQRWLGNETGQPLLEPGDAQAPPPDSPLTEALLAEHEARLIARGDGLLLAVVWPHAIELFDHAAFLGTELPRAIIPRARLAPARPGPDGEATLADSILSQLDAEQPEIEVLGTQDLLDEGQVGEDEAPIIKLLNLIIVQAYRELASDIHIEAEESVTRVRYRVDGMLKEAMLPPKRFHNALVSRVKIMSDLDIAEKRTPQDGRMKLRLGGQQVDVRVSTLPSIYGEKVVLRILREQSILMSLDDLGFAPEQRRTYETLIARPYGIILVTGPTGSGKTTTLYTTLRTLNSKAKNIITIEDPVEYQVDNINQIQVNRRAGIDFASGLKSILRQDPDIIMLGEMRDEETASIAVKAALTGHLVFSTLHTNDAAGAYSRLQDMKVAPYLLASAIVGVIAQRLVRRLCLQCRIPDQPDSESLRQIGLISPDGVQLYRGAGCATCGGTGYRGRSAIYELLTPTREIKKMILSGQLEEGAEIPGLQRMIDHGREKVLAGLTSVEEVCRVVRLNEVY